MYAETPPIGQYVEGGGCPLMSAFANARIWTLSPCWGQKVPTNHYFWVELLLTQSVRRTGSIGSMYHFSKWRLLVTEGGDSKQDWIYQSELKITAIERWRRVRLVLSCVSMNEFPTLVYYKKQQQHISFIIKVNWRSLHWAMEKGQRGCIAK